MDVEEEDITVTVSGMRFDIPDDAVLARQYPKKIKLEERDGGFWQTIKFNGHEVGICFFGMFSEVSNCNRWAVTVKNGALRLSPQPKGTQRTHDAIIFKDGAWTLGESPDMQRKTLRSTHPTTHTRPTCRYVCNGK